MAYRRHNPEVVAAAKAAAAASTSKAERQAIAKRFGLSFSTINNYYFQTRAKKPWVSAAFGPMVAARPKPRVVMEDGRHQCLHCHTIFDACVNKHLASAKSFYAWAFCTPECQDAYCTARVRAHITKGELPCSVADSATANPSPEKKPSVSSLPRAHAATPTATLPTPSPATTSPRSTMTPEARATRLPSKSSLTPTAPLPAPSQLAKAQPSTES